jgi:hypothetical protein
MLVDTLKSVVELRVLVLHQPVVDVVRVVEVTEVRAVLELSELAELQTITRQHLLMADHPEDHVQQRLRELVVAT